MTTTTPDAEPPRITFELVTLFPEMFDGLLATTVIGKAIAAGHRRGSPHEPARLRPRQLPPGRRHALRRRPGHDHARRADRGRAGRDRGGARPLAPHPADAARAALRPGGARARWRRAPRITLVCGRYEGIDERVASLVDEQLCIGDFVLAGGELAAAVVLEATARLVPGVLGCGLSAGDESFSAGRLEYPQWTRPADWNGQAVAAGAAVGRPRGDRALAPPRVAAADAGAAAPTCSRPTRSRDEERRAAGDRGAERRLTPTARHLTRGPGRLGIRAFHGPASASEGDREQLSAHRCARPPLRRQRSRSHADQGRRQGARADLRGRRDRPAPRRIARLVHGPQGLLRRRRRAHLPAAHVAHREDRGLSQGRGPARAPQLPARAAGQGRPHQGREERRRRRRAGRERRCRGRRRRRRAADAATEAAS